jgi:hypothetical protein
MLRAAGRCLPKDAGGAASKTLAQGRPAPTEKRLARAMKARGDRLAIAGDKTFSGRRARLPITQGCLGLCGREGPLIRKRLTAFK